MPDTTSTDGLLVFDGRSIEKSKHAADHARGCIHDAGFGESLRHVGEDDAFGPDLPNGAVTYTAPSVWRRSI